ISAATNSSLPWWSTARCTWVRRQAWPSSACCLNAQVFRVLRVPSRRGAGMLLEFCLLSDAIRFQKLSLHARTHFVDGFHSARSRPDSVAHGPLSRRSLDDLEHSVGNLLRIGPLTGDLLRNFFGNLGHLAVTLLA